VETIYERLLKFRKYDLEHIQELLSEVKSSMRSPSIPLKKGEEFNSPPFLRGAGGDLDNS